MSAILSKDKIAIYIQKEKQEIKFPLIDKFIFIYYNGEFDPGSGRTLAACLTHASLFEVGSLLPAEDGERVSNA